MTTNLVVLQTIIGNPLNLHHSILKAASRRGFYFVGTSDSQFRLAKLDDPTLLSGETFGSTSEALEAFDAKEVTFVTPKEEKGPESGKCGVMNSSYHKRYSSNPHGPGNGDGLDIALRDAFVRKIDGKVKVDVLALKATGEACRLWNPSWEALNPGLQRMNLANRIRARLRNSPNSIELLDADGAVVDQGRFGIECKVKA